MLIALWTGMVLLSVVSLSRTLRVFKALRNVYCSQAFEGDLKEVAQGSQRLTFAQASKRLIPAIGAFSYSDLQFDLPPPLHSLLTVSFLSLLLLSASVSDELSPSSDFTPGFTILQALLNSAVGLAVLLLVEWAFVRSVNWKFRGRTYRVSQELECRDVDTTGIGEDKGERQELTFRNTHTSPAPSPNSTPSFPILLESLLLLLLILSTFTALWSLYTLPRLSPLAVLNQWACGVLLDFCVRLGLGGVLAYANVLPNYQGMYRRFECGIGPEDLERFVHRSVDAAAIAVSETAFPSDIDHCPPLTTTLTEETQRHISTWTNHKQPTPPLHLTCSEDLTEGQLPTPVSEAEGNEHLESSVGLGWEVGPAFPPLVIKVTRGNDEIEACPPPTAITRPPDPIEEFPFPAEADRFSDIGSLYGTQLTLISPLTHTVPAAKPVKPGKPDELAKAIYGSKPALFGKGAPLQSVRKQRKGRAGARHLESIVSESEEDREPEGRKLAGNRSTSLISIPRVSVSPKAADSSRYQAPASPFTSHPINPKSPEPDIVLPQTPKPAFEPGNPLPPLVCDPDLYLHMHSPTAADDSPISFLTSEKTTTRDTLQHSLHPSRRNHSSSSSLARNELRHMLREGEETETWADLAKMKDESMGVARVSLKKSLVSRPIARLQRLPESGSPYEELLWRMMKEEETPNAARCRQPSRVRTLLAAHRDSGRSKMQMTRHRSLTPLPQASVRMHRMMYRHPSVQVL